jgi:hypothetical protein
MHTIATLSVLIFLLAGFIIMQGCSGEDADQASGPSRSSSASEPVKINGKELTAAQIDGIEQTYGVRPVPGDYWYDQMSGLYGIVGQPAFGFMYAGHDFGPLDRDASGGDGDTGVVVNGRELPQTEWLVWSQVLGYAIAPGDYWFDQSGNAGNVGNPYPTVNLYAAAMQNGYTGGAGGGGGDNTWSSRFGAGNYDSGNQRGYVSVPGHGPVGYGF